MIRTYSTTWRNKWLTANATTIDDMIEALEAAAAELRAMRDAGVRLEGGAEDDFAHLVTTDPAVAEKYGFEEDEVEDDLSDGRNGHDAGGFEGLREG
jgi:hypothetical protein